MQNSVGQSHSATDGVILLLLKGPHDDDDNDHGLDIDDDDGVGVDDNEALLH